MNNQKIKTNPSSSLNQPYQIISNWGIIKNLRQYNDRCQLMYVDEQTGDGYFEHYDFGSLNLARLNCQFNEQHTLTNHASRQGYWIFIILQGQYQLSSIHEQGVHSLKAPCILLLKGELGKMTASISHDMLIQSFYIEFDNEYFAKLQQQLQNNPNYDDSILRYFFNLTNQYCFIPLTFPSNISQTSSTNVQPLMRVNPTVNQIMKQSWQLFRTPIPTDEISLMTLQGITYSFVSELLMQSYSKLYQLNLNHINQLAKDSQIPYTEHIQNTLRDIKLRHIKSNCNQLTNSNQGNTSHSSPLQENPYELHAIQVKLLLEQFYYENWTIRQLAKKVHTNECYLKRDFKRLTGMTIANYRNQIRMQQALKLLEKELKTVEIANQLGFNSHAYFLKSFKKYYQCLPYEYYKK